MFLQKFPSFLRVGGDTRSVSTLLFGTSEWHGYRVGYRELPRGWRVGYRVASVWVTVAYHVGYCVASVWVTVGYHMACVWVTVGYRPYVDVTATSYETQMTIFVQCTLFY